MVDHPIKSGRIFCATLQTLIRGVTQQIQKRRTLANSLMPSFERQTYPKEAHMKSVFKPLLLAGVLASASFVAFAQAPGMGPGAMMGAGGAMHEGMGHHRMNRMDPAKMQARMEKRQAVLKASLKLTPAQEGAWTTFTAALKPPADFIVKQRPDPVEIAKLTTPERIDKMKVLRTQHMNEMNAFADKRGEATKVFYAALTPEQQKVFDASVMRHRGPAGRMGGPRDGRGPVQPRQ